MDADTDANETPTESSKIYYDDYYIQLGCFRLVWFLAIFVFCFCFVLSIVRFAFCSLHHFFFCLVSS